MYTLTRGKIAGINQIIVEDIIIAIFKSKLVYRLQYKLFEETRNFTRYDK
jgi:hypothetical protein